MLLDDLLEDIKTRTQLAFHTFLNKTNTKKLCFPRELLKFAVKIFLRSLLGAIKRSKWKTFEVFLGFP